MNLVSAVVIFLSYWSVCNSAASWSYTNTATKATQWANHFKMCGENRQSPIDLPYANFRYARKLTPVNIMLSPGVNLETMKYEVENNGHSGWSYTNAATKATQWANHFKMCGENRQSPINLPYANSRYAKKLTPVDIILSPGVNLETLKYEVENNGHSVLIKFPPSTWKVALDGSEADYEAVQMHFHWGSSNSFGSEHHLDGKSFSLEAHLVCFNSRVYDDWDAAKGAPDGIAVLGFLNQVMENVEDSATMLGVTSGVVDALSHLKNAGCKQNIAAFDLRKLLDLVDPEKYFRYAGSLTTPPCTQNVAWTVFDKIIPATSDQLQALRKLKFGPNDAEKHMANNFRPIQPLNPRRMIVPRETYRSWDLRNIVQETRPSN